MGAEFVTFDNAVNAMPLLCRVLYEGAAYMAVLKNFLCLFYYLRIIRRADYRAEITVFQDVIKCISIHHSHNWRIHGDECVLCKHYNPQFPLH